MYFNKSLAALIRCYKLILKDKRFLLLGFFLAIFGSSYQGFEFFRLHTLPQVLPEPAGFKLIYLLWQVISWIMSLLLGSVIFPSIILMIVNHEEASPIQPLKVILGRAKEISYRFIIFLFTYYNFIFVIAGGGFLVAVAALVDSIYYNRQILTVYDLTKNTPIIASFLTLAVIAAAFVSLLFNIISQVLVLEEKGIIESVIDGMKMVNKDLPYVLSAWIILSVIMLMPLIALSIILNILDMIALHSIWFSHYSIYIGLFLFLIVYTPVVTITTMFWTEIYLSIKGKITLTLPQQPVNQ